MNGDDGQFAEKSLCMFGWKDASTEYWWCLAVLMNASWNEPRASAMDSELANAGQRQEGRWLWPGRIAVG